MTAQLVLLREALREELERADTRAGSRIYIARKAPVEAANLPALVLWTPGDTGEYLSEATGIQERAQQIVVECQAKGSTVPRVRAIDEADELGEEVERWVEANRGRIYDLLGCTRMLYQSYTHTVFEDDTHVEVVVKVLRFEARMERFLELPADHPLRRIHAEIEIGGGPPAERTIDLKLA